MHTRSVLFACSLQSIYRTAFVFAPCQNVDHNSLSTRSVGQRNCFTNLRCALDFFLSVSHCYQPWTVLDILFLLSMYCCSSDLLALNLVWNTGLYSSGSVSGSLQTASQYHAQGYNGINSARNQTHNLSVTKPSLKPLCYPQSFHKICRLENASRGRFFFHTTVMFSACINFLQMWLKFKYTTVHPESIHSALLFPHFVMLQPYSTMEYIQHPIMTNEEGFFFFFFF